MFDKTTTETLTVWYKNDEVINNTAIRNLTLTLKSFDTGIYKCGINGTNSTNDFIMTVEGMSLGVFSGVIYWNVLQLFVFKNNEK